MQTCLPGDVPVLAATDYMRAFSEQIRSQLTASYTTLGTDGFGCSDTRQRLRDYHEVSARFVIRAALSDLSDSGDITAETCRSLLVKCDNDFKI